MANIEVRLIFHGKRFSPTSLYQVSLEAIKSPMKPPIECIEFGQKNITQGHLPSSNNYKNIINLTE
jgi:hypothetical protein